jgi:CarD family transcriptional regulator
MAGKKKMALSKARSDKPAPSAARTGVKAPQAKSVKSAPVKSPKRPPAAVASKPAAKASAKPTAKSAPAKAAAVVKPVVKTPVKSAAVAKPATKPATKPAAVVATEKKIVPLPKAAPVEAKKAVAAAPVKAAAPVGVTQATKALAPKAFGKPVQSAAPQGVGKPVAPAAGQFRAVAAAMAKSHAQRISAPVQPKVPEAAAKAAPADASKKPVNQRHGFKINESVVYPAHGVGRIVGIEEQEIAGISLELFVITFEKDKMTLRVPTGKLASVGMRKLADDGIVHKAMETLKGRARIKRTMWSRRAQEYDAKINSGNLVQIAEVVRDLYRSEAQPEQSYSERQLYEAALDRMSREIAAVDRLDERSAMQRITEVLSKSAKGRRAAEATEDAGDDADDVRAA